MKNHVINQHFVPRFLLNNFSEDGFNVWCYDKLWKKPEKRSISKTASEKYFYDQVPGQKVNSLEYLLSKAESDTAPIIEKIIRARNLQVLSEDDKVVIALFISLQLSRTKTALKETESLNNQLMEGIKAFMKESDVKLDFDETPLRELWMSSFFNAPKIAPILLDKIWFLLESDNKFFTSDHPVVKQNYLNNNPYRGTLGLRSEGIEIYFPLSPSLALALYCEKSYVILKDIKLPPCSAENIENFNSLQVLYADRFIISHDSNFDLAIDMIQKGEV